jgi:MFS family permease
LYVPLKQPHFHLQTTPHPAVGGIQVVMTLVCTQLMDRAGRRPLLLTSTVGMAFCTALLSVYFTHKRAITSCALLPPASLRCCSHPPWAWRSAPPSCPSTSLTSAPSLRAPSSLLPPSLAAAPLTLRPWAHRFRYSPALGTAISLGALVGDIVFFSLGLGAIPWLLVSEVRSLLSQNERTRGVSAVRPLTAHSACWPSAHARAASSPSLTQLPRQHASHVRHLSERRAGWRAADFPGAHARASVQRGHVGQLDMLVPRHAVVQGAPCPPPPDAPAARAPPTTPPLPTVFC